AASDCHPGARCSVTAGHGRSPRPTPVPEDGSLAANGLLRAGRLHARLVQPRRHNR
nr:hypothetical protein [Tanacetum cinerariifolium]